MEELKKALGHLYEEFGHNDTIVALSQYLDNLIVQQQREDLECYKKNQLQKQTI